MVNKRRPGWRVKRATRRTRIRRASEGIGRRPAIDGRLAEGAHQPHYAQNRVFFFRRELIARGKLICQHYVLIPVQENPGTLKARYPTVEEFLKNNGKNLSSTRDKVRMNLRRTHPGIPFAELRQAAERAFNEFKDNTWRIIAPLMEVGRMVEVEDRALNPKSVQTTNVCVTKIFKDKQTGKLKCALAFLEHETAFSKP